MSTGLVRSLGIASWIAIAAQSEGGLRGRVLDAAGSPAVGARVFSTWSFPDPTGKGASQPPEPLALGFLVDPATTDEKGGFRLLPRSDEGFLYALSADGHSGAIAPASAQSQALELVLAPLVEVRGRFEVKAPGKLP